MKRLVLGCLIILTCINKLAAGEESSLIRERSVIRKITFKNALECSPETIATLLSDCKTKPSISSNEHPFLSLHDHPEAIVLTYSPTISSSEELKKVLLDIKENEASRTKEYIVAGYKKGAQPALLGARKIFDALKDYENGRMIKAENQIKFIAFYPCYSEITSEFCWKIENDLNIRNCLYFFPPFHRSLISPGIKINIIASEYYRDNPKRAGGALMFFPIFIAWNFLPESIKKGVSLVALWPLAYIGLDILLLQMGDLSESSVSLAYNDVQSNYRTYGSSGVRLRTIGEVPWFSTKRGISGWLYRTLT